MKSISNNMRVFGLPVENVSTYPGLVNLVIEKVLKIACPSFIWKPDDIKNIRTIPGPDSNTNPLIIVTFRHDDNKFRVFKEEAIQLAYGMSVVLPRCWLLHEWCPKGHLGSSSTIKAGKVAIWSILCRCDYKPNQKKIMRSLNGDVICTTYDLIGHWYPDTRNSRNLKWTLCLRFGFWCLYCLITISKYLI